MKALATIGIVLIIAGIIGLAYGGITYTQKDKVLDAGPLEVQVDKDKRIPFPPVAGGASLVVGVALVVLSRRRT